MSTCDILDPPGRQIISTHLQFMVTSTDPAWDAVALFDFFPFGFTAIPNSKIPETRLVRIEFLPWGGVLASNYNFPCPKIVSTVP